MQHPRSLRRLALSLCAFSLGFSFWSCAKADTGDSESVFSATKTYPLIISEYIHEGEKRAIEIFNTGNKRDLSGCLIVGYAYAGKGAQKGSPVVVSVPLSGSVKKNETVTLCSVAARSDDAIKARCDLSLNNFNMNGNDPFALICNGKDVDVFGLPETETTSGIEGTGTACSGSGETSWNCSEGQKLTANNRTLRRKPGISKGRTTRNGSFDLGSEWIAYPKGTWTDLGHHSLGSSGTPSTPDTPSVPDTPSNSGNQSNHDGIDIVIPGSYEDIKKDPNRRHQDLEGLTNQALIAALHKATGQKYRELGYKTARQKMFGSIDRDSEGKVECIYTGKRFNTQPNTIPPNSEMNAEHSWPQSGGATGVAKSDLHHIFPTETKANGMRSSYDFGETPCSGTKGSNKCDWEDGGSQLGKNNAGKLIFEVRPKFRGDIARAHFYFSVRYNLPIPQDEENILRAWHHEDPVDERERRRNNEIEKVQLNRNCFVDRPDFVDLIKDF